MDDINSDRRRRTAEPTREDECSEAAAPATRRSGAVDWVALSPLALVGAFALVATVFRVGGVDLPAELRNLVVGVAALASTWVCLQVGSHLFAAAGVDSEAGTGTLQPEHFVLVGWAVVAAVALFALDAFSDAFALRNEPSQVLFAVVVSSLVLSPLVSGPLFALFRYRHRNV